MNQFEQEKKEKILNKAFGLIEKGKTIPEILRIFPDDKDYLKENFEIVRLIKKQRDNIAPPKQLLSEILASISLSSENVTNKKDIRYLFKFSLQKFSKSFRSILSNRLIFFPTGIALIILLALTVFNFRTQKTDVFELAMIQSESKKINNFDSDLDDFFSKEAAMQEIDLALSEF
ncbi:MAG: hypothetical protein HYV52_02730 [Parcubacteria group bacterium]|nr:hypothetical protein [Parcubacteria group bacterium]